MDRQVVRKCQKRKYQKFFCFLIALYQNSKLIAWNVKNDKPIGKLLIIKLGTSNLRKLKIRKEYLNTISGSKSNIIKKRYLNY